MSQVIAILILALAPIQKPDVSPPVPITINANLKAALDGANKTLRIAQLEKSNLILQMRLILHIPNEYEWDEAGEQFTPPKTNEKAKP